MVDLLNVFVYNKSCSFLVNKLEDAVIFEIENIGKVKHARLEMHGVTVLAGENSTGKSTFGKALYCLFNAFYESDKEIMRIRKDDIESAIYQRSRLPSRFGQRDALLENILDKRDSTSDIRQLIIEAIEQRIIVP